jgi:hypothetical protein
MAEPPSFIISGIVFPVTGLGRSADAYSNMQKTVAASSPVLKANRQNGMCRSKYNHQKKFLRLKSPPSRISDLDSGKP